MAMAREKLLLNRGRLDRIAAPRRERRFASENDDRVITSGEQRSHRKGSLVLVMGSVADTSIAEWALSSVTAGASLFETGLVFVGESMGDSISALFE
jgi:hypothetical protein